MDVAVDILKGSPTFGNYAICELRGENYFRFLFLKVSHMDLWF